MIGGKHVLALLVFLLAWLPAHNAALAQVVSAPQSQAATVNGFATDEDEAAIPGATITVDGPPPGEHRVVKADDTGYFLILGLHAATPYRLTASAPGFANYTSPEFTLAPGQVLTLSDVKMPVGEVGTSITVMPTEQIAEQQVNAEIQQKVLGVIPNFYVVYGGAEAAPLTTGLKFKLAYKASLSPVNVVAAAFVGASTRAWIRPITCLGPRVTGSG